MNETIVSVRGVSKAFGAVRALQDVSLTVQQGMVTAIVGDNGSGKSTLIQLLSGNLAPDSGSITVGGQTYRRLQVRQALDMGIRTVYQDLSLDACKNSYENIFLGQELRRGPFLDRRRMAQEAVALLQQLEIVIPDLTVPVRVLSGGQRQGVAIARAMRKPGSLLLLDEPTKGLDAFFKDKLARLLRSLTARGTTVLMVSHDVEFCASYADWCALFFDGNVVTTNPPRQFFASNSFYTTAANRISRGFFENVVTVEEVVELCRS